MESYKFGMIGPDNFELKSKPFDTLEELKSTVERLKTKFPDHTFKLYRRKDGREKEIKQ